MGEVVQLDDWRTKHDTIEVWMRRLRERPRVSDMFHLSYKVGILKYQNCPPSELPTQPGSR